MSCLSANAKLVRDTIEADSSLQNEEVYTEAKLIMEPLEADAFLKREKIDVEASIVCTIGIDNSLWASDGVLYDGNSQPLFTTEKWES